MKGGTNMQYYESKHDDYPSPDGINLLFKINNRHVLVIIRWHVWWRDGGRRWQEWWP